MDSKSVTVTVGAMVLGTVYTGFFPVAPILNSYHNDVGPHFGSKQTTTSLATSTVFVNRKETMALVLANGDYYLNHLTGKFKVKAGASVTPDVQITYYTQVPYQLIYDTSAIP